MQIHRRWLNTDTETLDVSLSVMPYYSRLVPEANIEVGSGDTAGRQVLIRAPNPVFTWRAVTVSVTRMPQTC